MLENRHKQGYIGDVRFFIASWCSMFWNRTGAHMAQCVLQEVREFQNRPRPVRKPGPLSPWLCTLNSPNLCFLACKVET